MTSKLEKEISQSKFENQYHKLRANILFTSGWLRGEIKEFLDPYDITPQQFNILRILRGAQPEYLSTKEICGRMIDKMSDTSRLVDRLQAKGLVYKKQCDFDGRKIRVFITDNGLDLLNKIDAEKHQLNKILKNLSEEEAETLNDLLDKLRP